MKIGAKIPFAFSVAGKVLPAGDYRFSDGPQPNAITVRSSDGKEAAIAMVQTRIAAGIHTSSADAHVVFDRMNESYVLSELWMPGLDGYVLNAAEQAHEHVILNEAPE